MLKKGEELQPLGNGVSVIVSKEHHFFTDTILLATFSKPRPNDKAVDLGTGCGTIPLLWNKETPNNHTYAVEIQQNGADMAQRSVQMNNLQDKITVINADLNKLKGVLPLGSFDVVACNPPYKPIGTGVVSSGQSHSIIRHESSCTVDDVVRVASGLLRFGGRFCLCLRPERLTDVFVAFRKYSLEPKRLQMVQQRVNKAPKLFLVEGRRGGKPGGLVTLPTLFIENSNGEYSDEMMKIYGSFKECL